MRRIRKPAVAGTFYPASRWELERFVSGAMATDQARQKAVAVVSPHAGYVYSGRTAGAVFGRVVVPDTVVVLGPNHRGWGPPCALADHDAWETPLGEIPVDGDFSRRLLSRTSLLEPDAAAFVAEHSLEVQVPFIQHANPDARLVAICLSGPPDDPAYAEIGRALAAAVKESGRDVLIVASSDMSHYEPRQTAERKDRAALEAIIALDERRLVERVMTLDISMCGFGPVLVAIAAAKLLGATRGELVQYATSGDVTGDDEVVGYAGVMIR